MQLVFGVRLPLLILPQRCRRNAVLDAVLVLRRPQLLCLGVEQLRHSAPLHAVVAPFQSHALLGGKDLSPLC